MMKELVIVLVAILAIAVVAVWACLRMSGNLSRQEEQEEPCNNCLRWEECNGVDETCPWSK